MCSFFFILAQLLEIKQRSPHLFSSTRVCCAVRLRIASLVLVIVKITFLQAWQFLDSYNVALNIRRQVNDTFVGKFGMLANIFALRYAIFFLRVTFFFQKLAEFGILQRSSIPFRVSCLRICLFPSLMVPKHFKKRLVVHNMIHPPLRNQVNRYRLLIRRLL
jgi:hypothetical protein